LRGQIKQLAQAQRSLNLRHLLLKAWCESLQLIQVSRAPKLLFGATDEPSDRLDDLVQREVSLLETLTGSTHVAAEALSGDSILTGETLHPGILTIAPVTDPMAYFRWAATSTARQHEPVFSQAAAARTAGTSAAMHHVRATGS
jgi:hypothetical protein